MDALEIHSLELEKSTAIRRFRRVWTLKRLFHFVEFCAALTLVTWLSTRAPVVIKVFDECFLRISAAVGSPTFIFVLGNAIIVALFAMSGHLSCSTTAGGSDDGRKFCNEVRSDALAPATMKAEEIVYQDKEMIFEENTKPKQEEELVELERVLEPVDLKLYFCRSESKNLERTNCEEKKACNDLLRRSVTGLCLRSTVSGGGGSQEEFAEDGMSNEEFRRRIEAFIAKQVKFHRQESLCCCSLQSVVNYSGEFV